MDNAEAQLLDRIDAAMREIDKDTTRAQTLLDAEGVTALPEYVQAPLELEAKCTSPKMTRYLELLLKADRLLTQLEALRLAGVITTNAYDRQVAIAVRRLVSVPRAALQIAVALRKRISPGAPQRAAHDAPRLAPASSPNDATAPDAAPQAIESSFPADAVDAA